MLRPVLFAAFTLGWTFSAVARADDAVIRVPVAVGEGVDEKERFTTPSQTPFGR